ncbi:MAG TPA: CRISPR-associated helicase Cas3' [Blastocatellia bacterium]|nr:CRISPR-associated helicase Cas3' [Blastocatellia bacterium]
MDELLAKPDVPLTDHLWNVICLGEKIADRLRLDERLRTKALLACALHDIGKATHSFQEYMRTIRQLELAVERGATSREIDCLKREVRRKKAAAYPHALASLPFALVAEKYLGQKCGWHIRDFSATAAVLTHHSPLGPELYKGYGVPDLHSKLAEALEVVWELLQRVGVDDLMPAKNLMTALQPLLKQSPAALLDQSFPFGQERKSLRGILQALPVQEFAQVKAVLHLADWLVSAKQPDPALLFLDQGRASVEAHIQQFPLREFQRQAANATHNTLFLRAPTGTGKTEALLLWAGNTKRLIYLLPTQATVNAMWRRLRKIYGDSRVALAHGRASYVLRKEFDEDPLDMKLFGSVFARPVTVATLDQYLLAHLNGRHWEERRSLAKRATIILDEIHAYEPYTLGLLLEALSREQPARLALASATLPTRLLELFQQGRLVEAELPLWQRKRHQLQRREGALLKDGIEEALRYARDGRSVLLIANTISEAQTLYKQLKERGWRKCELLHARFIFRDRQKKEARAEKPQPGTIFVATQVVEVSLDISYDVLLTEIAPIDALVQRMGRVNRRGETPPAPVIIYRQWSEGSQRVYGKEMLQWSLELLETLSEMPTDRDLADVTHRLYDQVMASEDWKIEFCEGRRTIDEVQRILGCYTIDLSDEEMRSRFTARRGQISVEVLPTEFLQEAYEFKERGESWRLPELLVPVPVYWLKHTEFFTPIEDLRCIQTTLKYSKQIGLVSPLSPDSAGGGIMID